MDFLLLEKSLIAVFVAVVLAIVISKLRGNKLKLPPGPIPIPVFGNWLQVGDDLNHRKLVDYARKFGELFLLRMGQRNLVVISSPNMAKEVLQTQGAEFGSRNRNIVYDIFTGNGQDMVFTVYGEHWRKMRRIMTVPFFTNKVVNQNREGWESEAARVVEDLKKNPDSATKGIVLRKRLQLMVYNNVYGIMFGTRFESEDDPLFLRLKVLNGERSRLTQSFEYNYGDFIPILRPFLRGYLKICQDVKDRRLELFKNYFVDKRKRITSGNPTASQGLKCAIDHILEAQQRGEINKDNVLYIVENINIAAIVIGVETWMIERVQLGLCSLWETLHSLGCQKKQPIVTLSTCEAEYVAATSCVCHAIWLRNLMKELHFLHEEPTEIRVDNKSALALAKNPVFHDRSKHIDIHYHYIRECIANKEIELKYVKSQEQAAYIFTKPLKQDTFVKLQTFLESQIKFKGG